MTHTDARNPQQQALRCTYTHCKRNLTYRVIFTGKQHMQGGVNAGVCVCERECKRNTYTQEVQRYTTHACTRTHAKTQSQTHLHTSMRAIHAHGCAHSRTHACTYPHAATHAQTDAQAPHTRHAASTTCSQGCLTCFSKNKYFCLRSCVSANRKRRIGRHMGRLLATGAAKRPSHVTRLSSSFKPRPEGGPSSR